MNVRSCRDESDRGSILKAQKAKNLMTKRSLIIRNQHGLHARVAALLVELAAELDSSVFVIKGSEKANGRSIIELMNLGAGEGSVIEIVVSGGDEALALDAVSCIFENGAGI